MTVVAPRRRITADDAKQFLKVLCTGFLVVGLSEVNQLPSQVMRDRKG
jgi:hypothetical protein